MARSRHRKYEELTGPRRRRMKALLLARATLVGLVVIVGYYALPMNDPGISGIVVLVVGLLVLAGVLA